MKQFANSIENLVNHHYSILCACSEAEFSHKPMPAKWSKKEIIGHLIDSAQNNLQRFVRGQYETLPHIVYHQDEWVSIQQYQAYDRDTILDVWKTLNRHLCHVLLHMPEANWNRQCDCGKAEPLLRTLAFLAEDYVAHMEHHLAG